MNPQRTSRGNQERGFTLLELIVVLAVLALAAVFAVPLLNRPAGDAALMATARSLANGMRAARAAAIRDNAERTLTIDVAARRFWVDGVTGAAAIPAGVAVDVLTLRKEQLSADRGRLRFFVDGSATGGNIVLRAQGRMVAVELDWASGHARIRQGRR